MAPENARPWWRGGVIYQIYPRSFADANGDGVGDLAGIRSRLDYLEWLGVDAIWLGPIHPSPNEDWGYDVADYVDVHPELGTLAELDALVADAGNRGIRVLLDLAPNHTSDRHAWFSESRSSRRSPRRDWYVWADPRDDNAPPNNWVSTFGGPAWTLDEPTEQFYLHNFLPSQPDLNWWSGEVRDAFDDIVRFWLDRGIAGFRIDVAHGIVKDRHLRDNPDGGNPDDGQGHVYNMNRPEVHEVHRRWRSLADSYDDRRVLIGETWVMDLGELARYYGNGHDELHLAFNFPFALAPLDAAVLGGIVDETEAVLPPAGWPVWTFSNHDIGRLATRTCGDDPVKIRCALFALLTLRGTPVLYYGDELGLPDVIVPKDRVRDHSGRDRARTPMHWTAEPGGGFSTAAAEPWLPLGDTAACNVADQRDDPGSILALARDLIAARRARADLRDGAYAPVDAPPGVWAWRRGRALVALNLSGADASVEAAGTVALASDRAREGDVVGGALTLAPWEAAVVLEEPAG